MHLQRRLPYPPELQAPRPLRLNWQFPPVPNPLLHLPSPSEDMAQPSLGVQVRPLRVVLGSFHFLPSFTPPIHQQALLILSPKYVLNLPCLHCCPFNPQQIIPLHRNLPCTQNYTSFWPRPAEPHVIGPLPTSQPCLTPLSPSLVSHWAYWSLILPNKLGSCLWCFLCLEHSTPSRSSPDTFHGGREQQGSGGGS